jgi:hypothetical protein
MLQDSLRNQSELITNLLVERGLQESIDPLKAKKRSPGTYAAMVGGNKSAFASEFN